ncbi:uncharacterized protein [Pagrus major]|uniref:uncharacterized protein n=1 Tax=Pagrus major TaxID=143350 RepID=UPI003CC8D273
MNWTEAQSYCRDHHTDLASVRNTAENQEVKDVIPSRGIVWIGLFRDSWKWSDGRNSSFRYWDQGEPDNYGENQACVVANLGRDGKWRDHLCSRNRSFVCYSPPAVQTTSSSSTTSSTTSSITSSTTSSITSSITSSTPPTSSTTQPDAVPTTTRQVIKVRLERKDSSLDLNDPAVLEQMLKEFKQRLKDQGVDGDVKLSWRKQSDGKVFHKEEETKKKKKKDEL